MAHENHIAVGSVKVGRRHRKNLGNLTSLMTSINTVGLLHPIVINEKNHLVAGARRLAAFKALKYKIIPYTRINIKRIVVGELAENVERQDFLPSELNEILREVDLTRVRHRPEKGVKFTPFPKGKTRDVVADMTGKSNVTLQKVRYIFDHGTKEEQQRVDRSGKVDRTYNEIRTREKLKNMARVEIPPGTYNVIVRDPGWNYDNKITGGSMSSGASQKYMTEDVHKIIIDPITDHIARDAVMFLWVTTPMQNEAMQVVTGTGFTYKTKIYWDKMAEETGKKAGYWFNNTMEELWVCVRGNVRAFGMKKQQNVIHIRATDHSVKPDVFMDIIDDAASRGLPHVHLNKIELNARRMRKGWTCIGNEFGCKQCNQYHIDTQHTVTLCKCKCHTKFNKQ